MSGLANQNVSGNCCKQRIILASAPSWRRLPAFAVSHAHQNAKATVGPIAHPSKVNLGRFAQLSVALGQTGMFDLDVCAKTLSLAYVFALPTCLSHCQTHPFDLKLILYGYGFE